MTRPPPHPVTGERADLGDLVVYALDMARIIGRRGGEDPRTASDLAADLRTAPDACLCGDWFGPRRWIQRLAEMPRVTESDVQQCVGRRDHARREASIAWEQQTREGFAAAGFCEGLHDRAAWDGQPSAYVRGRLAAVVR